jgi:aldose 1-epimerase
MNLLLPFSNRIAGPFAYEGQVHALPANLEGEPFPIHGDAFQRPWDVVVATDRRVTLGLSGGLFGPYRYEASVTYGLTPGSLDTTLTLTSRSALPLPFGLGFHPWFPRSSATRVRFSATGCWPQTDRHLLATAEPVPLPPGWDFGAPAPLPPGWVNAGFSGWDGEAEIQQDDSAVPLRLSAPGLSTVILYSPSAEAPFVCLEPVSHAVDAHNLPGQPGLVRLAPGESLSATMSLRWDDPDGPGQP